MYSRDYYNKNLREGSRMLRNSATRAELKIWNEYLRHMKPRVHRQRPMGNFIVDFYIPKAKLVLEIDGEYHLEENVIQRDKERTWFLNSLGLEVLRFTNDEVFKSFDFVCEEIRKKVEERMQNTP